MAADDAAVRSDKVARLACDVVIEEPGKCMGAAAALADKAEAHTLILVGRRQAHLVGEAPHVGFQVRSEREERLASDRERTCVRRSDGTDERKNDWSLRRSTARRTSGYARPSASRRQATRA